LCEIGESEFEAGQSFCRSFSIISILILADWKTLMARKSRNPNFDQTLEILRDHSFDVAPFAGVSGGVLVSKH